MIPGQTETLDMMVSETDVSLSTKGKMAIFASAVLHTLGGLRKI
tara:strand:+ start:808 stop:939 length:132 start_codon:yes stop_codon:yes gene_type:complete